MPESAPNHVNPTRAHAHVATPHGTQRAPGTRNDRTHPIPRTRPENQGNERTNDTLKKARLRANIRISSQNVNGAAAPTENMNYREKWRTISHTMHTEKIAILAIQESHLDHDMTETLGKHFEKNLVILNSTHPDNPRASAGVSFVINKQLMEPDEIEMSELIPGRAAVLKVKWLKSCSATLLNVYAPNDRSEHANFWAKIMTERRAQHLPIPDLTMGDFNVTEDAIDRMPPKLDDESAIAALREVRHEWDIRDTWRQANPTENAFTYRAQAWSEQIQARLDRIYVSKKAEPFTFDWDIKETAIPTDHAMVSVRFAPKEAPQMGKGRWTLPLALLNNEKFLEGLAEQGISLQANLTRDRIERTDRGLTNPQTHWEAYKKAIHKTARETAKECFHKVTSRIKAIERDLRDTNNSQDISTNREAQTHAAYLTSQLRHLKKKEARNQRDLLSAKLANHGERLGGIWSALGKEKRPRNPIHRLKIPNTAPPQYERSSKRMAELARNHHDTMQEEDIDHDMNPEEYNARLADILNDIPESQRLEEPERTAMSWKVTEDQVRRALQRTKDGTATGLDGCPYELWKALEKRHNKLRHKNVPSFDIIKALTYLFRDIQEHGVDDRTNFTTGWMCPIFKKKDPTEISNYRPITLLNTDYKLLTKVLAIQLLDHVSHLVHPDQAGFIPNRSIFDHIRPAKAILNYAEVSEEDGAILALDQEKAYDKIRHDYLWRTLEAFRIPQPFIRTVQALYSNAHTKIAVNGVFSDTFKVKRGVRQGDPLSCPLFDLAIEPLACRIRADPNIKGILIPGIEDAIKITLFADDTNLFLSKDDRLDYIQQTLDEWCRVSGARFNIEKTEVLPIGTETHRRTVAATRKINPLDNNPLPPRIRIASDGEAVRMLGAWIGNGTNDVTPWEPILDIIKSKLSRWEKAHLTLNGKRIVIQTIMGGHTQFLTKAQGMPSHIEEALTNIMSRFIWNQGIKPRIAMAVLRRPIHEGGLNILDINARNEAIEIVWLRAYLNFSPSRQKWATITDHVVLAAAPPQSIEKARDNPFLQTWKAPLRGPRAKRLNGDIRRMLKTARKYQVNLAAIRMTPHLLAQLPAWYHLSADQKPINNLRAKCLLQTHNVSKVADLVKTSARLRHPAQHTTHRKN